MSGSPAPFQTIRRRSVAAVASMLGLRPSDYLELLQKGGVHERGIGRLFPGRLAFAGSAPVFDRPLILIAFTNRSGSGLLGSYLAQSGGISAAGEFLNHKVVATRTAKNPVDSFPDYLRQLAADICPAGKMLSVKASWDQIVMLARWNVLSMFPGVRVLHIRRQDAIAQAVSFSIASQTGRWSSRQNGSGVVPEFRPDQIGRMLAAQALANQMIMIAVQALALPVARVDYEQLCAQPKVHVRRLLSFCKIATPEDLPLTARLEKQADATNEEFCRRYRAILRGAIG